MRTIDDLKMMGGNDYYITCVSEDLGKMYIAKDIYAISADDTLYLNTAVYKLPSGYSKVLSAGKYFLFRTGFRDGKKGRMVGSAMAFGAIGAAIASLSPAKSGTQRVLCVLDAATEKIFLLERNYLLSILKDYPDIEYQ